jgi:hypothetical protein
VCELLAEEYPDVNFIIPHLGSFADDWRAQVALIDHLVRHPNIYTDTAGVRRFDILEQAVQRAGARKILHGSDGPWLHPGIELAKVRTLGLSRSDETLVLGDNFLRLIERVGRPTHARNGHRLAHSAPVRRLGAQMTGRGDLWLQEDIPYGRHSSWGARAVSGDLSGTARWQAFTRFLGDGRICLSDNAAERAVHGVAIGRSNWTFAGSDAGGH